MSNEQHARVLAEALAGSSVVDVGTHAKDGRIVLEFSDYILVLGPTVHFELSTKDNIKSKYQVESHAPN